jgi:hypothetical protein
MVWAWLFGTVSFELFGQLAGTVTPERRTEVFDAEATRAARGIGLPAASLSVSPRSSHGGDGPRPEGISP